MDIGANNIWCYCENFGIRSVKSLKGYQVAAYLRNPEKLNITNGNLTKVKGGLSDYESVKAVLQGAEAVAWCVGISMKKYQDRAILDGHKVLLKAMEAMGVKWLID